MPEEKNNFGQQENSKAQPLSKESVKHVPEILKSLHILYANLPIYPVKSDIVTAPLETLYLKISAILSEVSSVVFSNVKNLLVVNGERLKDGLIKRGLEESFLKFFSDLRLESITFKRGVTKEELLGLAIIFTKGPEEGKEIIEVFKEKGIRHIILNDIIYDASGRSRNVASEGHNLEDMILSDYILSKVLAVSQGEDIVEKLEKKSKDVAEALTQLSEGVPHHDGESMPAGAIQANVILELMQKLSHQLKEKDPKEWEKCKKGLSKTFMQLRPDLRYRAFFQANSQNQSDIVEELWSQLPEESFTQIFFEAYQSGEISTEEIKAAVRKLSQGSKEKTKFLPALKEKLTKAGLSSGDAHWLFDVGAFQELSLPEKIERIKGLSLKDYFFLRKELDIAIFVRDLCQEGQAENIPMLIAQLKKYYSSALPEEKLLLIQDFAAMNEVLLTSQESILGKNLETLSEIVIEETLAENIQLIFHHLTVILSKLFAMERFIILGNVFKVLDSKPKSSLTKPQSEAIERIEADVLFSSNLNILVEAFIQKTTKNVKVEGCSDLFAVLNETAVRALVEAAMADEAVLKTFGYFDAFIRRRVIGEALVDIIRKKGIDATHRVLLEYLKSPQWYIVKNTVELIIDIHDTRVVDLLAHPLRHEDDRVKKKAVFALGKIGGPQSVHLLNEALQINKNFPEVRLDIISVLGRIGDGRSLAVLQSLNIPEIKNEINSAVSHIEQRTKKV